MKLTADQGLVVDWIAGSSQVTCTPERGLIFRALSVARRGYTAMLRQQKLLRVDAECLFLICLGLLFALNCSFWYVLRFLISNLLRLQDTRTAYVGRTETKEERKRTRTTKRYTSNSLKLVEEVTPQILFLDTKPFIISTDELFQVDAYL